MLRILDQKLVLRRDIIAYEIV
jgi:hypothetical protein